MGKQRNIGAIIIEETLNNMRAGAERLYYTVQVPTIYHIYLHQEDYEKLLPIESKIIAETKRALEEELAALNRPGQINVSSALNYLMGFWQILRSVFGKRTVRASAALRYEKGMADWQITLYPDPANDLKVGDLVIESELALAPNVELGAGLVTKTIRTIRIDGMTKSFEVKTSP